MRFVLHMLMGLFPSHHANIFYVKQSLSILLLKNYQSCINHTSSQQIQTDLQYIKEDISAVERHRLELYRTKERYSMKLRMLLDDPAAQKMWPSPIEKASSLFLPNPRTPLSASCPGNLQNKKLDLKGQVSHQGFQRRDALTCSDPPNSPIQSGNVIARKRRVQAQVSFSLHALLHSFRRNFAYTLPQNETSSVMQKGFFNIQ